MSATPLHILQTVFGYAHFRGHQQAIVEHMAEGGDALVLMPTGGGKSLCYQIPALLRQGTGIVVSPLIALMHDQVDALREAGVAAAYLNSSLDAQAQREVERKLSAGELNLLYVAPERLLTGRFLELLDRTEVALFAIDKAHCVSQWGHDFRPEYRELTILHQRFPNVPRIALTATADPRTREEIVERLVLQEARQFVSSFDRPNIRYTVTQRHNPRSQLMGFLDGHRGDAGIVYCLSRRKVDETAQWLSEAGIEALPYHAGLDAAMRMANQQRFLREDGFVMVATVAFGMGIDKPDVRFVAHIDLPKSVEGYYQETGRAGRDGLPSTAWLAYGLQDVVQQRRMIDDSPGDLAHRRRMTQHLDAMLALCETVQCRRINLLGYFGQQSGPCGNCDTCLTPPESWDGTVPAQKLLSTVVRLQRERNQRFGAGHLIDIVRGKRTPRVEQYRHDQLATWSIGDDLSESQWRGVVRQLIAQELLKPEGEYGVLTITPESAAVLSGERRVILRREPERPERASRASRSAVPEGVSAEDEPVFQALRTWRAGQAREQGVPAYIVFGDATLRAVASARPATLADLDGISGIGAKKRDAYGEALLSVVAAAG